MKDRLGNSVKVGDTVRIFPENVEKPVVGLDAFTRPDGSWRRVAFVMVGTWKTGAEAKNLELVHERSKTAR